MDVTTEILVKGTLTALALVVVLLRHLRPGKLRPEQAGTLLWTMAVIAVVAWPNFGRMHGRSGIHHWEQFHYFLGSKYFPELRYDGLYAAALEAESEMETGRPLQFHVRDLRTNEVVPTSTILKHRKEVRARFSEERWQSFEHDVAYFVRSNDPEYLRRIRLDHGYNPTPVWTFTARFFSRFVPATDDTATALALLDPLLLTVLFVFVFRTYGPRIGCMALIVFGLGYPWRFDWVGGAFLRQDWLAASGIAVCMLRRKRWMTAGILISYATMVRIFPGAFLVGPTVVGLRHLIESRKMPRETLRMAAGFVLGVLVLIGAGSVAGRGPGAWPEFLHNLEKHHGTWLTNNVGLENLLLYDRATVLREDVDWSLAEPWLRWQAKMDRLHRDRRPVVLAVTVVFLAIVISAMWRMTPDEASVAGIAVIFSAVLLTCYYWVMLCFVPLGRGRWGPTAGWLTINLGLFGLHLATPAFEMIYGVMSLALALFFLAWLAPDAGRTLRDLGSLRPGQT